MLPLLSVVGCTWCLSLVLLWLSVTAVSCGVVDVCVLQVVCCLLFALVMFAGLVAAVIVGVVGCGCRVLSCGVMC